MGFYTRQTVLLFALFDAQDRLSFLCFYTGETSRLWWASVLLLSEPRQSVHTVRVPYQPSVFAPFFLKSAGWVLIWTSAVLLWFLALLYTHEPVLSIRRVHNELDILFQETTKKLWESYKYQDERFSLRQNRRGKQWAYYKQVILYKSPVNKISGIKRLTTIWILYTRYTWSVYFCRERFILPQKMKRIAKKWLRNWLKWTVWERNIVQDVRQFRHKREIRYNKK